MFHVHFSSNLAREMTSGASTAVRRKFESKIASFFFNSAKLTNKQT